MFCADKKAEAFHLFSKKMQLQNYKLKYSTTTNNKVFVAGTFSNWAPKEMTPQGDGCFTFEVNILEKELLFKFIEDGVWLCSGL